MKPPEGFKNWKEYKLWRKQNPKPKPPKYYRIGIFTPDEVLPFSGKGAEKKEFLGEMVRMTSQRYELFKEKGMVCVKCGLVGTYFALEKDSHKDPDGEFHTKSFHFNLYGINQDGKEIMLTKDHILPKSKGGKSILENYQTMCSTCNWDKGNKTEVNNNSSNVSEISHSLCSCTSMEM